MEARRRPAVSRCAALLAFGLLVGAAAATARLGQQADRLSRQRQRLEHQVVDLQARLRQLEQSLSQHRRRPIRATAVRIHGLDPLDELQLRRQVQEWLAGMVGREVDQVDPALVAQVLDGRLVSVGGRHAYLLLESVWVTETLTVSVQVRADPGRQAAP